MPQRIARNQQEGRPEVIGAVRRCSAALIGVALFSAAVNVLALTGSIYMLQLYDRVLPAHSVPTLIALTGVMVLLYASFGVFDALRVRMLSRIGVRMERILRARVFLAVMHLPLRTRTHGDGLQPVRDLDQIRGFLSGLGPTALFDLPWMPFYLAIVYWLHPLLGYLGAAGAAILMLLTILTEVSSRRSAREAASSSSMRQSFGEATRRNAESIRALGMNERMAQKWEFHNEEHLSHQLAGTDVAGTYGALSKVLRMVLQSAVLGLGAYLVIIGQATAGVMIAASILVSRALAPVEIAIANWRGFVAARQSATRLADLLSLVPDSPEPLALPPPVRRLDVAGLWVIPPGSERPALMDISFSLVAGEGLGIIGPAASGKSTLARALVGAWNSQRGAVRLDGAALDQWSSSALGGHIGYLPQAIELMDGTVGENIARFDPEATGEAVVTAAMQAGVHDMIVGLPEGYQTRVGESGSALSAGQRQRVALARALYGVPFLVVLDEPNSNLDAEGDAALTGAIASVRGRGGIIVVIAHRPSALAGLDQLMVLGEGRMQSFGPKDEVLRKTVQNAASISSGSRLRPVNEVAAGGTHAPA